MNVVELPAIVDQLRHLSRGGRKIANTLIRADSWDSAIFDFAAAIEETEWRLTDRQAIIDAVHEQYGHDAAIGASDIWSDIEAARPYRARSLADVEPQPIEWLWPRRFPAGKLSLLAGQPGRGKSQLTISMAATVTRGGVWPDGSRAPRGSVIIVSCEDDVADTIRPRAEAAGADLDRIRFLESVRGEDGQQRPFSVDRDAAIVGQLAEKLGDCRLIVIDPITAFLGRIDSRDAPQVRGVLQPLVAVAEAAGACTIIVSHLSKATEGRTAMERVTGSGAFVALARTAWLVERDVEADNEDQEDGARQHVLVPLKNNIGDDRTGFRYVIESATNPGGIETSRTRWKGGPVTTTAEALLERARKPEADTSALSEACDFLKEELATGPRLVREIGEASQAAGIAKRTLRRAAEALGVVRRKDGSNSRWTMKLPDAT